MTNTKKYGLTVLLLTVISQHVALAGSPTAVLARAIEDFDSGKNISFDGPLENGLMQAIRDNNYAQAIKYLEKGANPNTPDKKGDTPLMLAVWNDQAETVKILLQAGAKTELKNKKNQTALDIAKELEYQEIEALLKSSTPTKK